MSFEQEQFDLESRFATQWAALANGYPVIYDNSPISPPASGPWLRFRVHDVDSNIAGIGGTKTLHRNSAFIEIVVSDDKGVGSARAKGLADDAAAIFRDARVTGFRFKSPWPQRLGEVDGWFRYALTIRFERDAIY